MNETNNIHNEYVSWANSLDSAGKDSTEARKRMDHAGIIAALANVQEIFIGTSDFADDLKKFIFYGKTTNDALRDIPILTSVEMMNARTYLVHGEHAHENMRYLHALLGLMTELGEMFTKFHAQVFEAIDPDWRNFDEEVGDLFWYMALLARVRGYGNFVPFLISNRAKLTARYGDTWSQERALNRDTENEILRLQDSLTLHNDAIKSISVRPDEDGNVETTVEFVPIADCEFCGMKVDHQSWCPNNKFEGPDDQQTSIG